MNRRISYHLMALLALILLVGVFSLTRPAMAEDSPFEVWIIDQADTTPNGGGTLYIYKGSSLAGQNAANAQPEVIDLGAEASDLCLAETGSAPRRPHMILFNDSQTHAVISFVATGHVLFVDAATRQPVRCIDVGLQAHAAFPSADQQYVVVANQNGKLLQRIITDYAAGAFDLDNPATLNFAVGTTPSGALREDPLLRPDNAPICPIIDDNSRFAFVTLRGGGMFVVDITQTPMAIVADYDRETIHPNGCGGVETAGKMYINSGGGTAANPLESDLYAFQLSDFSPTPAPPNTPVPTLVFSHDDRGFVDSHGIVLTKHGRYIWAADRAANLIVVVDTTVDQVINEIELAGALSDDPAPDLMALSPSGNRVFLALRGPNPLTGNAPGVNNAVGSTPGVGVVRVERNGQRGVLQAIAPITHLVDGVERADPHGIAVRMSSGR